MEGREVAIGHVIQSNCASGYHNNSMSDTSVATADSMDLFHFEFDVRCTELVLPAVLQYFPPKDYYENRRRFKNRSQMSHPSQNIPALLDVFLRNKSFYSDSWESLEAL